MIKMLASLLLLQSAVLAEEAVSYGKVLEVKEVMGYNYLKVDENGTERWVAIAKAPVKVGDRIGYDSKTVMKNFKSKRLNRTFDEIIFANEVYLPSKPQSMKAALLDNTKVETPKVAVPDDFVEKPLYTVEELFKYRAALAGKTVSLKAKVRKVSHQIMKRDWIHLEDGTGLEQAHTNDIVFTAVNSSVKAGEEVIATGTIVIDKDFGYGYFYPVLGEKATFKRE